MTSLPAIQRFESSTQVRIYRIPCEVFPNFIGYVYVVLGAGEPTLIDTGSGYGDSTKHVLDGIQAVHDDFNEPITREDIKRIIITHGHIDHFGGLVHLPKNSQAKIGIHTLDRRVITNYEERVVVTNRLLRFFIQQAGVPSELQAQLIQYFNFSKKHTQSFPVDFPLSDGQEMDGMRFIHTPGHCPGMVCIAIGNILLSADHILEKTSPHQSPETITRHMGLHHYLESLDKVSRMGGFDVALGGHEGPIHNVYQRIGEIRRGHMRKLDRVRGIIQNAPDPLTTFEIAKAMFRDAKDFHLLLAIEEAAAHVEYLYEHGELAVSNIDEVEIEDNPPLRYRLV
ncbi:MBL fold metallo-hydrolase [bacterium]|nr:MBL fold metallo-hydrolase [bacterium]